MLFLHRRPSCMGTPLRGCAFNSVLHWPSTLAAALRFYMILNDTQALQGYLLLHLDDLIALVTAAQLQIQPKLAFRAMEVDDSARELRSRSYRGRLRTLAVVACILSR